MKFGFTLMRNKLTPLAKIILVPLGLMAAATATDQLLKRKFLSREQR